MFLNFDSTSFRSDSCLKYIFERNAYAIRSIKLLIYRYIYVFARQAISLHFIAQDHEWPQKLGYVKQSRNSKYLDHQSVWSNLKPLLSFSAQCAHCTNHPISRTVTQKLKISENKKLYAYVEKNISSKSWDNTSKNISRKLMFSTIDWMLFSPSSKLVMEITPKLYSASSLRPRKQLIMNSQDVTLYVLATNHSTGHNDRII
jgi:hypothetical protein